MDKKRFFLVFFLCVFFSICLFAEDEDIITENAAEETVEDATEEDIIEEDNGADDIVNDDIAELDLSWEKDPTPPPPPYRVKNRKIEVGFLNIEAGFANNFLSAREFFRKTLVIDIDKLNKGFGINVGANVYPLYFNYNKDDDWGFGVSLGVQTAGLFNLSGKMLSFDEAENEKSDLSGAIFAELKFNSFFHIEKIKIKIKPAFDYPVFYAIPDISHTYKNSDAGTILDLRFKMRVFTAFPWEGGFRLTAFPGLDVHLGAEYPLSEIFGLKQINSLLDFTLGLDLINLPMVPSVMNDFMDISGHVSSGGPIDFLNGGFGGFSFNIDETVYGTKRELVFRPFKMLSWAEWRPFNNVPLSFIQTVGFMLSPFYEKIFSLEAGIKARIDFRNMFIFALETAYYDRLWKNTFDIAMNFRAVEFDLGIGMRSQDFLKSWTGTGFSVNIGFKFGW